MEKIKVTLEKSLIGRKKNHIETARSLGLKKIGDSTVVEKNDAHKAIQALHSAFNLDAKEVAVVMGDLPDV